MKTILQSSFILLFVLSCRTTPENENITNENNSYKSPISVKINFIGVGYGDNIIDNQSISVNNTWGGGDSLINFKKSEDFTLLAGKLVKSTGRNSARDSYIQDVDDYTFAEVKNILDISENSEYLASIDLSLSAKAENLPDGAIYTVLSYKNKGGYVFHKRQDFSVGDRDSKIELDEDSDYLLLIVSYGTSQVPIIYNVNDINKVYVDTSSANVKEVLYQKQILNTRGKINYELNIKLSRPSSIRISIDTGELISETEGKRILSISDARITYPRPEGISLYNFESISSKEKTERFNDFSAGYMLKTSEYVNILNVPNTDIKFSADVRVDGIDRVSSITDLSLDGVRWGYRQTFNIKQIICGAYTGPNKTGFREFMCHNLGNGYGGVWTDKFVGSRYTWGRKDVVTKESGNPYEEGDTWKESENPCPSEFRVPTLAEWEAVLDDKNNIRGTITNEKGEFVGFRIGGRLSLFEHTDFRSWLWTSDEIPNKDRKENNRDAYSIWVISVDRWNKDKGAQAMGKPLEKYADRKEYGQAVRCIRK